MQVHIRMRVEERHHLCRFMGRQVVRNDVDLAVAPLRRHDLLQERDELVAGVTIGRFAEDHTRLRLQGGLERQGPVADVLKAVALGAAGRQRQNGVAAVEGLNRSFFIHAEDGRMLRRIQLAKLAKLVGWNRLPSAHGRIVGLVVRQANVPDEES
jgi:hypothetical protein